MGRGDLIENYEGAGPEIDNLADEAREFVAGIGAGEVGGGVKVIAAVLEGECVGDVVEAAIASLFLGIARSAVVMRPIMVLPAIVAHDFTAANGGPILAGIEDKHGAVRDGSRLVIHVVARAE